MRNPPHPGEIVKWDCLETLGLSVKRAAVALGVTRQALSSLINGRSGVSTEMACRLSAAFGSTPETWLRMQMVMTTGMPVSVWHRSRWSGSQRHPDPRHKLAVEVRGTRGDSTRRCAVPRTLMEVS